MDWKNPTGNTGITGGLDTMRLRMGNDRGDFGNRMPSGWGVGQSPNQNWATRFPKPLGWGPEPGSQQMGLGNWNRMNNVGWGMNRLMNQGMNQGMNQSLAPSPNIMPRPTGYSPFNMPRSPQQLQADQSGMVKPMMFGPQDVGGPEWMQYRQRSGKPTTLTPMQMDMMGVTDPVQRSGLMPQNLFGTSYASAAPFRQW